jgi:hypothetical protein
MDQIIGTIVALMLLGDCNERGLMPEGQYEYVARGVGSITASQWVNARYLYHQVPKLTDERCKEISANIERNRINAQGD